eukprot:gene10479-21855_t
MESHQKKIRQFSKIPKYLQRDKYSFKFQLMASFLVVISVALAITIGLCYGSVNAMGSEAYNIMKASLTKQRQDHLRSEVAEISAAISSRLDLLAGAMVMETCVLCTTYITRNAKQNIKPTSYLFPDPSNSTGFADSILVALNQYPDFNFVSGCTHPNCPRDFGLLDFRSRLKGYGSIDSSSLYVYSSKYSSPARNSSFLNKLLASNPNINTIVAATSQQDRDLKGKYLNGPNDTISLAITIKIGNSSSNDYIAIQKSYPGTNKQYMASDPSKDVTFTNAPVDAVYISRPFTEALTQQMAISISTRKIIPLYKINNNRRESIHIVSRADISLDYIQEISNNMNINEKGFLALILYDNLDVLFWGNYNKSTLISTTTSTSKSPYRYKSVLDVDANLNPAELRAGGSFDYTDPKGIDWYCASLPFYATESQLTGISNHSLILLLFERKSRAVAHLNDLSVYIRSTTDSIGSLSVILCVVTIVVILGFVSVVVQILTRPLTTIYNLSKEIVRISCDEDKSRDFSDVLKASSSAFNINRLDEVGVLAQNFSLMVAKVHRTNEDRKARSKYPANPFYMPEVHRLGRSVLWSEFEQKFRPNRNQSLFVDSNGNSVNNNSNNSTSSHLHRAFEQAVHGNGNNHQRSNNNGGGVGGGRDRSSSRSSSRSNRMTRTMSNRNLGGRGGDIHTTNIGSNNSNNIGVNVKFSLSLKSRFLFISSILLAAMLFIMTYTVLTLRSNGDYWVLKMGDAISKDTVNHIQTIVDAKSIFIESYFEQATLDVLTAASFTTTLLSGNLTNHNFTAQKRLSTYSLDMKNYYAYKYSESKIYSGYYLPNATACSTQNNCAKTHNLKIVQQTAMVDFILPSYLHQSSNVEFYQIGFEDHGLTRNSPYAYKKYGDQTQCYVEDISLDICYDMYYNSKCGNPNAAKYPPYDPRCRVWYQMAVRGGDPNKVYFIPPRVASTGNVDVTSVTPLKTGMRADGKLLGVVNSNILAQTLSDSVNKLKILDSGYCFLISTTNTTEVILHPTLSASFNARHNEIQYLFPALNPQEYNDFRRNVLLPIQNHGQVASTYFSGGKEWHLAYSSVVYGTVDFTLIATVPVEEVLQAAKTMGNSVNNISSLVIILSFSAIVLCVAFLSIFVYLLVDAVINPLSDLLAICKQVVDDDLNIEIPKHASSLDMKILLEAFGDIMIALRFGSESYARGNTEKARDVFEDALRMYTTTGSARGVGISHNNLGVVDMAAGDFAHAETHFLEAIRISRERLTHPDLSETEIIRTKRTLSDRLGNLALLRIEQQNHTDAITILSEAMEEDFKQKYVLGYVVRQGTLGQLNLKTGYIVAAERMMMKALKFIVDSVDSHAIAETEMDEAAAAEQIAIFNIGVLRESQEKFESAEEAYLDSLTIHKTMHVSTTKKALSCLKKLFNTRKQNKEVALVETIASKNGFILLSSTGQSTGSKRVILVVDYSGSMSGVKMKSAIGCVKLIFHEYINTSDSVMLIHFSDEVVIDFPIQIKGNNEHMMETKIDELCSPNGTSAFYDAVVAGLNAFEVSPSNNNDWIVVLTEGDDSHSSTSYNTLIEKLKVTKAGLIIIGIGGGMQRKSLEGLTHANKKGVFVLANGDQKSVDDAFREVAVLIQGQVMFEDM